MRQKLAPIFLVTSLIAIVLVSGCLGQTTYGGESGSDVTGDAVKETRIANVTRVIDGDTVVTSTGERIRLVCIDAPEIGQTHADEAKERLEELVLNKDVELEPDKTDKDKYDRTLRYIWVDGKLASEVLIEEGLAKSYRYPPDLKYCDIMDAAQEDAQDKKVGIWENWDPNNPPTPCEELGCPEGTEYVGSLKSDKYHLCTGRYAKKIAAHNLNCFDSKEEAESQSYVACKVCKP